MGAGPRAACGRVTASSPLEHSESPALGLCSTMWLWPSVHPDVFFNEDFFDDLANYKRLSGFAFYSSMRCIYDRTSVFVLIKLIKSLYVSV